MLISHFDMRLLQQWTLSDFIPGLICLSRCLALLLLQMMLQFFLTGWFNAGVKNTCAWKTERQLLSWPTIRSFAAIVKIFHGPAKIFYKWIISTIMSWTLQVHGYWDPIDGVQNDLCQEKSETKRWQEEDIFAIWNVIIEITNSSSYLYFHSFSITIFSTGNISKEDFIFIPGLPDMAIMIECFCCFWSFVIQIHQHPFLEPRLPTRGELFINQ